MADKWTILREWPELILDRLDGAGVARITLNRPEKRNALNGPLVDAFFDSLDLIRADEELKVVISRGAGKAYSSGMDLHYLRATSEAGVPDWDRPTNSIRLAETLRLFPRIMIAQLHGYCLGGAFGLMNCHDLAIAADDCQIGMPEILRGSFGQLVGSTLLHSGIPLKKMSYIQLVGRNITGKEADNLGIVTTSAPADKLEEVTLAMAREIASRHLAPLAHAKIQQQLGRDLTVSQSIQLDQLLGQRLRRAMDPFGDVDAYLKSQKGGTNADFKRDDA
jgi:enoyl-CoA hydratase/carnithine racemase